MDPKSTQELIEKLHHNACQKGDSSYIDPLSGYTVFTKDFHLKRGHCCNSGCRHCPYSKAKTPSED